ncbi:hypothetical protein EYV94_24225 [Puteibacter caeruleilacunae]|nr:hypothetical protein EYV94_24225 [Puteibacter caeruleilacunae]
MEMIGIIAFCTWGGYKLDQMLGNERYYCTVISLFISALGAVYYALRKL